MTTTGIITPFQRDVKNDWANKSDVAVVRADVKQALAIDDGELEWDGSRGSKLRNLRHRSLPEAVLVDLARVYASEVLRDELPYVAVRGVAVSRYKGQDGGMTGLKIQVFFDVIDPVTGNVLAPGQSAEVAY